MAPLNTTTISTKTRSDAQTSNYTFSMKSDWTPNSEQLYDLQVDMYLAFIFMILLYAILRLLSTKYRRFTSLIYEGKCYLINLDKRAFKLTFAGELHLLYCETLDHRECGCKNIGGYFKDVAEFLTKIAQWNRLPMEKNDYIKISGSIYKVGIFLVFVIEGVTCGTGITSTPGVLQMVFGSFSLVLLLGAFALRKPRLFMLSLGSQGISMLLNALLGEHLLLFKYIGIGSASLALVMTTLCIIMTLPFIPNARGNAVKETTIQREIRHASTKNVEYVGNSTTTIFHTKHHIILTTLVIVNLVLIIIGGVSAGTTRNSSLAGPTGTTMSTITPSVTPMKNPFEFKDLDELIDYVDIYTINKGNGVCSFLQVGVDIVKYDTGNASSVFFEKHICLPIFSTIEIKIGSVPEKPVSLVPLFEIVNHEDLYDHALSIFFVWVSLCTSIAIWRAYHRLTRLILPCNFSDEVWYVFVHKDVIKVLNDGSVHGLYCPSITYNDCDCKNQLWFRNLKAYFRDLARTFKITLQDRSCLYITGSVYTVFGTLFLKIKEIGAFDPLDDPERLSSVMLLVIAAISITIMVFKTHWVFLWCTLLFANFTLLTEGYLSDRLQVYRIVMLVIFGINVALLIICAVRTVIINRHKQSLSSEVKGNVNMAMSNETITKVPKGDLIRNIYPVHGTTFFIIVIKIIVVLLVVATSLADTTGPISHDIGPTMIEIINFHTALIIALLSIIVLVTLRLVQLWRHPLKKYPTESKQSTGKESNPKRRIYSILGVIIKITFVICVCALLVTKVQSRVIDQGVHVYGCNCKTTSGTAATTKASTVNRHLLMDIKQIMKKVEALAAQMREVMSFSVPACAKYDSHSALTCERMTMQLGKDGKMYLMRQSGGGIPVSEFKFAASIKIPKRSTSVKGYYFDKRKVYYVNDTETSSGFFARRYGITTRDMMLLKRYPRFIDPLNDPSPSHRIIGIWSYYSHTSKYCTNCVTLSSFKTWKKSESKAIADLTAGETILTEDVSNHTAAIALIAGKFDIINDNIENLKNAFNSELSGIAYERLLDSICEDIKSNIAGNSRLYEDAHMDLQNLFLDATRGGKPTLSYPFLLSKVEQLAKKWQLGTVLYETIEVHVHENKLYLGFKTISGTPVIPKAPTKITSCDYCVSQTNNGFSVIRNLKLICRNKNCGCRLEDSQLIDKTYVGDLSQYSDFYDNALCISKDDSKATYILHDPNDHLSGIKQSLTDGFLTTDTTLLTFSNSPGQVAGTLNFDVLHGYDIRPLESGSYTLTNYFQAYTIETQEKSISLDFPVAPIKLDSFKAIISAPEGVHVTIVTTDDLNTIVNRSHKLESKANTLIALATEMEKRADNVSFTSEGGSMDLGGIISNVLSGIGKGGLALLSDVASIPAKILSSTFLTFIPYVLSALALAVAIFWPLFLQKRNSSGENQSEVEHIKSTIPEEVVESAV